eukprot:c20614_g3_i1.p1 GENE.c20614_g3_i1~~c20614_g3_i1.p1  ORF type:complete len:212 (-),score=66.90 c20614_g3_i1:19-654(-)
MRSSFIPNHFYNHLPFIFYKPHCGLFFPPFLFDSVHGEEIANGIVICWISLLFSGLLVTASRWNIFAVVLFFLFALMSSLSFVYFILLWSHHRYGVPRQILFLENPQIAPRRIPTFSDEKTNEQDELEAPLQQQMNEIFFQTDDEDTWTEIKILPKTSLELSSSSSIENFSSKNKNDNDKNNNKERFKKRKFEETSDPVENNDWEDSDFVE